MLQMAQSHSHLALCIFMQMLLVMTDLALELDIVKFFLLSISSEMRREFPEMPHNKDNYQEEPGCISSNSYVLFYLLYASENLVQDCNRKNDVVNVMQLFHFLGIKSIRQVLDTTILESLRRGASNIILFSPSMQDLGSKR